jgi:2'-5' RNA ligase
VALDIAERERAELAAWRDELIAGRTELRAVKEEALHITLAFLGWRPEKEIPAISAAIERAYAERGGIGAFLHTRLVPEGIRAVPPKRPRLFALSLVDEEDRAAELQQAISDALEAQQFYKPEKRPWWPHITLARVKRNQRAEPLEGKPPMAQLEAAALTLYRSTLRPQGAHYEPLARVSLCS